MSQRLKKIFEPDTAPLMLANDNGPNEIGQRTVGYRTGLSLGSVNRLLNEDLRGKCTLAPNLKDRLFKDRDDLRADCFVTIKPVLKKKPHKPLNQAEMKAICEAIQEAAIMQDEKVEDIEKTVNAKFNTVSIEELSADHFDHVFKFITSAYLENKSN